MRRIMFPLLLLTFGLSLPTAVHAQISDLYKKGPDYRLGSTPELYKSYELRDVLGWLQVAGYDADQITLSLTMLPPTEKEVRYEAGRVVEHGVTFVPSPGNTTIRHGEMLTIKAYREEKSDREYHLRITWRYDWDDEGRYVVLVVKVDSRKLD